MSKPANLQTKIFLDGGDPTETEAIRSELGFLDGQTTNPSLVAKNPTFVACKESPDGCSDADLWNAYRDIVTSIEPLVPESVSIEVYADHTTTAAEMIERGRELHTWISNAHVKLPINAAGLEAAATLVGEGVRVNMTLCFTQAQAAAVFVATRGATPGQVYLSPFVGRIDDQGEDGMSFVRNLVTMFTDTDGHVQPLVASVRSLEHVYGALALAVPIITAPGDILREWVAAGLSVPGAEYTYNAGSATPLPYTEYDLTADWRSFDITHPLTTDGLQRFADDWNAVLTTT